MAINYTTPSDHDHLAQGAIRTYSHQAGEMDVAGLVVVPEPAALGLVGLFGGALLYAGRKFRAAKEMQGV